MSRTLISGVLGIVPIAALAAAPCLAEQPTVFGPTGLIRVPGAYTAAPGSMAFSGHASSDFQSVNMVVGVIDRLELSAGWVHADQGGGFFSDDDGSCGDPCDSCAEESCGEFHSGSHNGAVISGKYRLWGEESRGFALAAGIFDITNEFNASVFATVEKTFRLGDTCVTGMAGFGEHNSLVDGFFAGAEFGLGRNYRLMMEYDGDNFNGALHVPVNSKLDVGVGVLADSLYGSATYYLR